MDCPQSNGGTVVPPNSRVVQAFKVIEGGSHLAGGCGRPDSLLGAALQPSGGSTEAELPSGLHAARHARRVRWLR